jgi:hypothetical protein
MTYRLKGFVQLAGSVYSTPSSIAAFGEISTQSLTYSKNKKVYVNSNTAISTNLIAFLSQDTSGNVEVPGVIKDQVFSITEWVVTTQTSNGAYTQKAAFLNALTNQFNINLSGVNCGDLIKDASGTYFPEWIGFTKLGISSTLPYGKNEIKIWYADGSFRSQYDENEIVVIPPVVNLNDFFGNKVSVETKVNEYRENNLLASIQTAKDIYPESSIMAESYLWIDPTNTTNRLNITWTVLVYGNISDQEDYIKIAIRNYIAQNSTRTESEWRAIFPDIYKNTEFLILPRWRNYAIEERQLQVGQHSPISNLAKEIKYIKDKFPIYSEQFIQTNLCSLPIQYRSLNALAIGGLDNRDNLFSILSIIPDYLNVPTSSTLFELMRVSTKEWSLKTSTAIIAAETMGSFDNAPSGMRKVLRGNILFISFKVNGIEFLVSTKATTPNY